MAAQIVKEAEAAYDFALPAGPLDSSLGALSSQSHQEISYSRALVAGRRANEVEGRMSTREALSRLLQGSNLTYRQSDGVFILVSRTSTHPENPPDTAPTNLQTITVTGTRIRGGTTPSPVITIGSEQIQQEGFTDLGEVIRSVPQNFSGGQNPGVIPFTISGAGVQNTNLSGGSALNLRGLGADATLTLLNGRRMAYDGISQAVDISAIPVEAVERIEIVPDGSSAIYGSDAVGGVGNVILKRGFEGVTLGAGYGKATDGGLLSREYTATAGHRWSSGSLIATYKDVSADPIYARQRPYTRFLREPYTLYPGSDMQSALISFHQELGAVAALHLDAFRTERKQAYGAQDNQSNVYVRATPDAITTLISPGVEFYLPNDWTVSLDSTRSKSSLHHAQFVERPSTGAVLLTTRLCYCNEGRGYEAGAEGPLFALPAGDARLAVGVGRRKSDFLQYDEVAHAPSIEGDEATRFAYAELRLPVLGEGSSAAHGQRLELTAAARHEDYDSFGSVLTPRLGVIYSPGTDVTLKASWGKSFKAPTLFQRYRKRATAFNYATAYGGAGYPPQATVLLVDGGNPNLQPERARTWTASLAVHPSALPGLEAELTWFDIDYMDRVVAPVSPTSQALTNPAFAEFVDYAPSAEEQAAAIGDGFFYNYIGVPYDPKNVVAIVRAYNTNVARQKIHGLDLSASYGFDMGGGRLVLRGSSSWLRSTQQVSAAEFALAGTLFNPPKLTGRVGAVWSHGGFAASAFANYKDGVENVAVHQKTASFTTFDTTVRYAPTSRDSAFRNWTFALSMENVFNRPPPLHDTSVVTPYLVPPYDATNYSAIGRYVHVSVSRHW